MMKFSLILIIAATLAGLVPFSHAFTDLTPNNSINAVSIPHNPQALQSTTINLTSRLYDLPSSTITWFIGEEEQDAGVGLTEFTFNVGPSGSRTIVIASIRTTDGILVGKKLEFNIGRVDIVWEADTYVPPFYPGKALPIADSMMTAIAAPTFFDAAGKPIAARELSYQWKQDRKVYAANSGLGRQSFSFRRNQFEPSTIIEVEVTDPKSGAMVRATETIVTQKPMILFYEDQPLSGTNYGRAITGELSLLSPTISLKAEPFYFKKSTVNTNLQYNWLLNGKNIPESDNSNVIHLQTPGAGEGRAQISVNIKSLSDVWQTAQRSLVLLFKASNN